MVAEQSARKGGGGAASGETSQRDDGDAERRAVHDAAGGGVAIGLVASAAAAQVELIPTGQLPAWAKLAPAEGGEPLSLKELQRIAAECVESALSHVPAATSGARPPWPKVVFAVLLRAAAQRGGKSSGFSAIKACAHVQRARMQACRQEGSRSLPSYPHSL